MTETPSRIRRWLDTSDWAGPKPPIVAALLLLLSSGFVAHGAEGPGLADVKRRLADCALDSSPYWCPRFYALLDQATRVPEGKGREEWREMPVVHNFRLCTSMLTPDWCDAFWARLTATATSEAYRDFLQRLEDERLEAAGQGPIQGIPWMVIVKGVAEGKLTRAQMAAIRKSAREGDARALELLGWMYSVGQNVRQDYMQAYRYYGEAFLRGNTGVKKNMDAIWEWLEPHKRRELRDFFDRLERSGAG